jgi:hypothetical protein
MEHRTRLFEAGVLVSLHLYPAPQHVDPAHAAWGAADDVLAALGGGLCTILQASFREFLFYALQCIEPEADPRSLQGDLRATG